MLSEAVILKDVFPYLRRRATFARRSLYAAASILLVLVHLGAYGSATPEEAAGIGRTIFDIILWLMLVAGLFECTLQGATSVSNEREHNTVDLWVLAGLEHVGMVISKAASVLARTAATLAAPAVPAVTAVFMGGRSVADAQAAFLALAAILVLATAVSVSVSAVSAKNASSVPSAVGSVFFVVAVSWLIVSALALVGGPIGRLGEGVRAVHPFTILGAIGEEKPDGWLALAYLSLVLIVGFSVVLLVIAGLKLRRQEVIARRVFQPLVACDRVLKRAMPRLYRFFKGGPGNVDAQPVLWRERIALANMKQGFGAMTVCDKLALAVISVVALILVLVGALGLVAEVVIGMLGCFWVMAFLYQIGFAVRASQAFSREFESGQMELITLTELDGETIVMGKIRAYARHWAPALAVTLPWAFFALIFLVYVAAEHQERLFSAVVLFAPFGWAFGAFSLCGVALLCSLYFKNGARALYATGLVGFLVPIIASCVLGIFACPAMMMPWEVRMAVEVVLMGAVCIAVLAWVRNYDRSRFYAKQEVLVLAVFAVAVVPRLAGGLFGPICAYLVLRTLMRREFDAFLKEEPLLQAQVGTPLAPSYVKGSAFSFTHLGIPPSIETRLDWMIDRVTGRAGRTSKAARSPQAKDPRGG